MLLLSYRTYKGVHTLSFDVKAHKRVFKAASLMGPRSGLPTVVDSDAEGKIIRIRPLYYEDYIDWESRNPWKLEARGHCFTPPKRTLPASYYLTYKKRVYSENRVRWPLKRVDWDPKGERNPQNRGKSKFVRISWDEAAQIIADEILRVREQYGMSLSLPRPTCTARQACCTQPRLHEQTCCPCLAAIQFKCAIRTPGRLLPGL